MTFGLRLAYEPPTLNYLTLLDDATLGYIEALMHVLYNQNFTALS
jgi:hypothetical protein